MIDINDVVQLLQGPVTNNLICRNLEFRPQNLAMFIAALSNTSDEYGYIIIGASENTGRYLVEGISARFKIEEPIKHASSLLSEQPKIEYDCVSVAKKNIYVIKVYKIVRETFFCANKNDETPADLFIRNLFLACIKLQSRKLYVNATEDQRNDFIADLLETNGYSLKDQTRRGSSAAGKASGEVDIFITNNGFPFTIIEALNLNSLDTTYLNTHLDKIYFYDTVGNAFNICLSYVKVKDFGSFWDKYRDYAKKYIYPVPLISSDIDADKNYSFSDIRFMTTTHDRSGKVTLLYHMCVKIQAP